MTDRKKIAVLDDYQGVALQLADWSAVQQRAEVTVFEDHLETEEAVAERLAGFQAVCVMRERTPFPATLIERLPELQLIASTGKRNASIDTAAAEARGIQVVNTGYFSSATVELTWALILASMRHLIAESAALRNGGWQQHVGEDLSKKTLAVLGLGNIGSAVAKVGLAFGMRVIAWSQNLTKERCAEVGVEWVSKEDLFAQADVLTVHLILSGRTRDLIGPAEFARMKPTARFVNTSRGPLVNETGLIDALQRGTIAGAAVDVYDHEPLPADHPMRSLPTLLATPHIGYVTRGIYERFYRDTVTNLLAWLDRS
jgi:phosphoglycerate dehydrogenase-like enzyme